MSNIKVSEMPLASNVNNEDIFMIVQNSANKKVSKQTLMEDSNAKIQELEQEIQSLKEASYKVIGTGTDITLNNTSNNKFLKLDVKGNTEQTILTGKNKMNIADTNITPSGSDYFIFKNEAIDSTKNYVISFNYKINNPTFSSTGSVIVVRKNDAYVSVVSTTSPTSGKVTESISGTSSLSLYVTTRLSSGSIDISNVMLEEGTTATDFEKYCGGIPSPNPTFPQSIKNVTGDVNVKIQNKNIAKEAFDKKLALSGSGQNRTVVSVSQYRSEIVKVKPNTTYTASGDFSVMDNNNIRIGYFDNYPDVNSVTTDFVYGVNPLTFTTGVNTQYILLYNSASVDTVVNNLQLEENSTPTTYVAHEEQNLPFTLRNDNLFDKNKVTYNYYLNTQGTLDSANNYCVSDYIEIEEGKTYYISARGTNRTKFYNANKQALTSSYDVLSTDTTFTAPTNAKYIRTSINYTTISLDTFIICEGTSGANCITQRLYEGSYLADDGIHNIRTRVVFDGSEDETWDIRSDTHEMRINLGSNAIYNSLLLANQFKQVNSYLTTGNNIRWVSNSTLICISSETLDTANMTLEQWKTYLQSHNLIIEFGISEETEAYTTTQQTQHNAIKEAMSYYGQTNISSTSDEASAKIDATAIGDLNLVIS